LTTCAFSQNYVLNDGRSAEHIIGLSLNNLKKKLPSNVKLEKTDEDYIAVG
jgi:hypothetical protein